MTAVVVTPAHWSYSALSCYEKCAAQYHFKHRLRLPDTKGPALVRGIKIHETMEAYLKNGESIPMLERVPNLKAWVDAMRQWPKLESEQRWLLGRDWKPIAQLPTAAKVPFWCVVKVDGYGEPSKGVGHVVDWKTGKIYDDNIDQIALYAAVALERFDYLKKVDVSLVYLDQKQLEQETITRAQATAIKKDYARRVLTLEQDITFRPSPETRRCSWCAYSKTKGGPCKAG